MKLKLLITRPIEDAVEMSKLFNSKKIQPIISPMIKIRKEKYNCSIKPDIFILTSKNGVRNFDFSVDKNSKTKVLTLGEETRKLAREKGLENIKSVNGDTNSLIIELEKVINLQTTFLHPTSQIENKRLKCFFDSSSSNYIAVKCYTSVKHNETPLIFKNFMKYSRYSLISVFSSRTAESLCDEIKEYNLSNFCKTKKVIVLSQAIKDKLSKLEFDEIFVTPKPNLESMIQKINYLVESEKKIESNQ